MSKVRWVVWARGADGSWPTYRDYLSYRNAYPDRDGPWENEHV